MGHQLVVGEPEKTHGRKFSHWEWLSWISHGHLLKKRATPQTWCGPCLEKRTVQAITPQKLRGKKKGTYNWVGIKIGLRLILTSISILCSWFVDHCTPMNFPDKSHPVNFQPLLSFWTPSCNGPIHGPNLAPLLGKNRMASCRFSLKPGRSNRSTSRNDQRNETLGT